MKNITIIFLLSSFLFMFCSKDLYANVYASQLHVTNPDSTAFDGSFTDGTGLNFYFFLNDSAKSIIISIKEAGTNTEAAQINAGALSRGKHSVAWDGAGAVDGKIYYYEITAEQDNYSSTEWTMFFDSGGISIFSRAADVITDMSSPLFGLFYAPNAGGPLGRGITIYNPDGSFHDPFLVAPDPGDASVWTSTDPTTAGVFDDLGRFYTCTIGFGDVRRLNHDYTLTTIASGFTSPKGVAVSGTGSERKIYFCDDTKVLRLDIGDDSVFTGTPVEVGNFANGFPRVIAFDDEDFMYVSFVADPLDFNSAGAGISKFSIGGTLPLADADAVWAIDASVTYKVSDLQFDYGPDRNSAADDTLYFACRAESGNSSDGIWKVDDLNSGFTTVSPIILEDKLYGGDDNINARSGLAMDAAGNLILMENSNEHVFFISPPGAEATNSFTTLSPDSITVGNVSAINTGSAPNDYFLEQNYPNPFNPVTTIRFGINTSSIVNLIVYNALGQQVAVLIDNEFMSAGTYDSKFDSKNLPSGTYIYKLSANNRTESRKMILLK